MKCAILTIGNELLLGRTLDSNAHTIAARLSALKLEVGEKRTVGDSSEAIIQALQELSQGYELLMVTGGLGPTADDRTREAVAQLLRCPLIPEPEAEKWLRQFYERRGLTITASMLQQAAIPKGSQPLCNPVGAAVGFHVTLGKCHAFFLPGVPTEMQAMWQQQVQEQLRILIEKSSAGRREVLTCRLLGMSESNADAIAQQWLQRLDNKTTENIGFGTQIRFPEVHLLFYFNTEQAAAHMEELRQLAQSELVDHLVDFSAAPIEELVQQAFIDQGLTLAVAESCSGGYICSRLLAIPGASAYFLGGAVTYSNASKRNLLGIREQTLNQYGAVSRECAVEMATAVRTRHQASIGLATTGILGPSGGTCDKPVGRAYGAIVSAHASRVESFELKRNRILNREELATRMLLLLIQELKRFAN